MANDTQQQNNRQEADQFRRDDPVEVILHKVIRQYAENGSIGKKLFSVETEKALQPEIEILGAYSIQLLQNPAQMLSAAFDPAQTEEMRERALKLYDLMLESLPASR